MSRRAFRVVSPRLSSVKAALSLETAGGAMPTAPLNLGSGHMRLALYSFNSTTGLGQASKEVVTVDHGHSQSRRSHQCVPGQLVRSGLSNRGNELMETRMGTVIKSHPVDVIRLRTKKYVIIGCRARPARPPPPAQAAPARGSRRLDDIVNKEGHERNERHLTEASPRASAFAGAEHFAGRPGGAGGDVHAYGDSLKRIHRFGPVDGPLSRRDLATCGDVSASVIGAAGGRPHKRLTFGRQVSISRHAERNGQSRGIYGPFRQQLLRASFQSIGSGGRKNRARRTFGERPKGPPRPCAVTNYLKYP
ncbi:hypothetical protein EVAR_50242_1 [Eumeta japonica]|uniref:Uncharacterized protein n=1 Tax=Eumeta variegata TaxID=151549 RepID=A0A4C1YMG5_EUMVA|nr:hypothetical protein EVAR_50242_1 [Eumeta japonica]